MSIASNSTLSTICLEGKMAGIFDIVQQQLSGGAVQQVAQRAGIDPAIAQQAVTAAGPMNLGGKARPAAPTGKAEVIHAEAQKNAGKAGVARKWPKPFTGHA